MYTQQSIRPFVIGSPVSRTMFAIIRVLIGSYFLAAGTGLILEPTSRTLFDAVLPEQYAIVATTAYLFITAFMIMTGKAVRPAALLLAIYIFWSAFVHFEAMGTAVALSKFWNDMALLGAVLLIAVTEPGGSESFQLWRKGRATTPRRVSPKLRLAKTPRLSRNADGSIAPKRHTQVPDDRDFNIFSDAWEPNALPSLSASRTSNR